jgi:hypothetical protein
VDDSERQGNACTKNHENFCGQDALLFRGALLIPFSFATVSLLVTGGNCLANGKTLYVFDAFHVQKGEITQQQNRYDSRRATG